MATKFNARLGLSVGSPAIDIIDSSGIITVPTDATVNSVTVGRGKENVASNLAYGTTAINPLHIRSTNTFNTAIGNNALNGLGVGLASVAITTNTFTNYSYYDSDAETTYNSFSWTDDLTYVSGTPLTVNGIVPTADFTVEDGILINVTIRNPGIGFTEGTTTVFTSLKASTLYGAGATQLRVQTSSFKSATNNTAIGTGAGSVRAGSYGVFIGHGASPEFNNNFASSNYEIVIGANTTGNGTNTVTLGNPGIITATYLSGTVTTSGTFSGAHSGTFSGTGTFGNSLSATGTVNLSGSSFGTHNFGTSQTSAIINIGGNFSTTTGAINIGRSIGAQTVNIAMGANTTAHKRVNIGTGGTGQSTITIGNTSGESRIDIGNGATADGSINSINIGINGLAGSRQIITIGSYNGNSDIFVSGTLGQKTYTVSELASLGDTNGRRAFVSNALNPRAGQAVVGGGTIDVPVYWDGGAWVADSGLGITTGTGDVVLNSNPSFATDITINGITVGRGDGNIATNTAFGSDALGSAPNIRSTNINNVAIGANALSQIGVGVATITVTNGGSGYNDDGNDTFVYSAQCTFVSGTASTGTYPFVTVTVVSGVITSATVAAPGVGFTSGSAVTMTISDFAGYGGSGVVLNVATWSTATNNTALGFNAGSNNLVGSNSVYIGSNAKGSSSNEIVVGANTDGLGNNTALFGTDSTTSTTIRGTTINVGDGSATSTVNIGTEYTSSIHTRTVNIASGDGNSTDVINIGRIAQSASGRPTTIKIGTEPRTTNATTINIGTGAMTFSGSSVINIGGTAICTTVINGSTLTLGNSSSAQTVNIHSGATTSGLTKTLNIGTGGLAGSTTNIAIGSTLGTSTVTVSGNLIVNGTTTTINSSTLTVDDKHVELGAVVSATISTTGTVGSITGSGPWTATITNMTSTAGLIVGSTIAATAGTGTLFGGSPTSVVVASIVSASSITYTVTGGTTPTAGTVTTITTTGANDTTANGGGITLKGTTDKTLTWSSLGWTSSEDFNLVTGKSYEINGVPVLSANGPFIATSETAPSSPSNGNLWWDSSSGVLKIYYTDINSSQWVDATAGGGSSGTITEVVFSVTGTTPAISPSNGTIQTWTLTGASTPTAGTWAQGQSLTLMVNDTASVYTVTWTSLGVVWVGGSAPTLLPGAGYTVIELWKVGSTIYGALVGQVA
jgi:hypothetical protein